MIQIVQSDADQPWHVRLRAEGNSETTLWSEQYASELAACAAVALLGKEFSPADRADYDSKTQMLHVWLHESDPKGGLFIRVQVVDERAEATP